jgi:hypothetical protein
VAKNGGTIAVESYTGEADHGTTFTLNFPLEASHGSKKGDTTASNFGKTRWNRATG